MEETTFDLLLRKAAEQTTRRETLGVLLGGAVLLTSGGEIEATEQARRRRRRNRQRRRRPVVTDLSRVRVTVQNPGPDLTVQFVSLDHTWFIARWDCVNPVTKLIPTNGEAAFVSGYADDGAGSPLSSGFVWINGTYAIEFWNLALQTPHVSAAVNGVSMNHRRNCPNRGTRALNDTAIPEGMTFKFKIYDKEFTVFRDWDTQYKEFTLTLPTNL